MSDILDKVTKSEYKYGFTTDIASDKAPKGLNEEIIKFISAKKEEPEWLLNWRLEALRIWQEMVEKLGGETVILPDCSKKTNHQTKKTVNEQEFNAIDYIIASKNVTEGKILEYYSITSLPINTKLYTPEWLVHLMKEKTFPSENQFELVTSSTLLKSEVIEAKQVSTHFSESDQEENEEEQRH